MTYKKTTPEEYELKNAITRLKGNIEAVENEPFFTSQDRQDLLPIYRKQLKICEDNLKKHNEQMKKGLIVKA